MASRFLSHTLPRFLLFCPDSANMRQPGYEAFDQNAISGDGVSAVADIRIS